MSPLKTNPDIFNLRQKPGMKSRKSFDKDITSYILELLWAFKLVIILKLSYLKTRYSGYRNTEFFNRDFVFWYMGYGNTHEFF